MKDWAVKSSAFLNDSRNNLLTSVPGLKSEFNSSSESLLSLLNASILSQQAYFSLFNQSTMNGSKRKQSAKYEHLQSEDEESSLFAEQNLKHSVDEHSNNTYQESPPKKAKVKVTDHGLGQNEREVYVKKKKKRRKSREKIAGAEDNFTQIDFEVSTMDSDLPKKSKKRKHKHFSVSETEDNDEKTKQKNFMNVEAKVEVTDHDLDQNKGEVYGKKKKKRLKSHEKVAGAEDNFTQIDFEVSTMDSDLPKKSKKRKHKHFNVSETEDNDEKTRQKNFMKFEPSVSSADDASESHKTTKNKHYKNANCDEQSGLISKLNVYKKPKKKQLEYSAILKTNEGDMKLEYLSTLDLKEIPETNARHSRIGIKKKKHKMLHVADTEDTQRLKSVSPELNELLISSGVHAIQHRDKKKSKERSSSLEAEDNCEKKQKYFKPHNESSTSESRYENQSESNEVLQNDKSFQVGIKKNFNDSNGLELSPIKSATRDSKSPQKEKRKHKDNIDTELHSKPEKHKIHLKQYHSSPKKDAQEESSKVMDYINESLDAVLEKRQVNDTYMKILQNLHVSVPWSVPVSHTIETRLSHPTKEQYEQFDKLDIKMKQGPYTKEEDQKIKDNWDEFCRDHDLQVSPTLFFPGEGEQKTHLPPEQRISFVRYLGKGLEHRMLFSIYNRFLLLFSTHKKGKFTPEEDNIILTYAEHSNTAKIYSVLSGVLNRSRELIKKRHNTLTRENDKCSWNINLMQDLVKNILEVTGTGNVNELKEFPITTQHWKVIQKKMGIPTRKLKEKWDSYIYPTLFVEEYHTVTEIQLKLVDMLYETGVEDRKNISWNQLAQNFDGLTGRRLYRIFTDMFESYVPKTERNNFRAAIAILREALQHMDRKERKLKKFIYQDGKLFSTKVFEPEVVLKE